ncbi:probable serine acetyltransferase 2 isoform X2 [Juglans microcarpa x Juglans regia]|uniref:probable serine acetyltransferase 2 isoform X2 n=1 Tax=Juglans microcarpa x Juglans regia TaxID=2249226 RepID=UPI001B7F73F9|nr:probable serine acetyltransferase 2 isoform X2 [Juglans microcarpa x Juglans regia]
MACLSDESWVSLPKMLSERLSLRGDQDEQERKRFIDSKIAQRRLEKFFPLYALGISRPDSDSVVSVFNSDDPLADPIWDAVKEEAKLEAFKDRDPACLSYCSVLLYLKGYHSLQVYRVAHALWSQGRKVLALALQSRISEVFGVDIHPAAKIGEGILLDHATGVVIGETAVVGNRVSLMHGVTLGGTGKEVGDRHPKVGEGALIGASANILGNIKIGKGAMVAAGSLVLKDIPPHSMVAGIPAKVIGYVDEQDPSLTMKHDASKEFFEHAAVIFKDGRSTGAQDRERSNEGT